MKKSFNDFYVYYKLPSLSRMLTQGAAESTNPLPVLGRVSIRLSEKGENTANIFKCHNIFFRYFWSIFLSEGEKLCSAIIHNSYAQVNMSMWLNTMTHFLFLSVINTRSIGSCGTYLWNPFNWIIVDSQVLSIHVFFWYSR